MKRAITVALGKLLRGFVNTCCFLNYYSYPIGKRKGWWVSSDDFAKWLNGILFVLKCLLFATSIFLCWFLVRSPMWLWLPSFLFPVYLWSLLVYNHKSIVHRLVISSVQLEQYELSE